MTRGQRAKARYSDDMFSNLFDAGDSFLGIIGLIIKLVMVLVFGGALAFAVLIWPYLLLCKILGIGPYGKDGALGPEDPRWKD